MYETISIGTNKNAKAKEVPPGNKLLYFQVNTVVGLFWIMLKISTWLVVFLVVPSTPFTLCTSFHNLHNLS